MPAPTGMAAMVEQTVNDPRELGDGWAATALDWLGLRWPEGDPGALRQLGDAWLACGGELQACEGDAARAAATVWTAPDPVHGERPDGELVRDFRGWFTGPEGPRANLRNGSEAASSIGTAFHGLATEIDILRGFFVAQLGLLVASLVGASLVVIATGGLAGFAVAAGGQVALQSARRILIGRMRATAVRVAARLVGQLLRRASQRLVPARARPAVRPARRPRPAPRPRPRPNPQRRPRREPDLRPDPGPRPVPIPFPPPTPHDHPSPEEHPGPAPAPDTLWDPRRRPRCALPPQAQEGFVPLITDGADPVYAGDRLMRIDADTLADGARRVTIDGFVGPPIPRQGFESTFAGLAESVGLPTGHRGYDLTHAWPHIWGSEARAGIYLAPAETNREFLTRSENFIRDAWEGAGRLQGGWVEVQVTAVTHPSSAWHNTGANLLANIEYDVSVCERGRVLEHYHWGLEIDPPSGAPASVTMPGPPRPYGYLPGPD